MDVLIQEIVDNLREIAGVDRLWRRGAVHRGGPHYRLKGSIGPISIGEDECRLLGRLIQDFRPRRCFIVGNAFGLSSVFIAKMMESNGGRHVVTLDNQSEGNGRRCADVAAELARRMRCRLLKNHKGTSPADIPSAAGAERYDLLFLDGLHRHPQVTRDFRGALDIATPDAVFVWHDYWMLGIHQSVEDAQRAGFRCLKINTSCEMVFGTRNDRLFDRLPDLHENTEPPRRRLRAAAALKACSAVLTGAVKARFARTR